MVTAIFEVDAEGHTTIGKCDSSTLSWLAGLLEGEGSFMSGPPSKPNLPRVSISMTDLDIIEKVGSLLKVKVFSTRPTKPRNKLIHACGINGSKAVVLMKQLKPLMGARRQSQIKKALASYKPLYKRCADTKQTVTDNCVLSWLAGLLEGEGSFMKGPPSKPHLPRVMLQMTDLDVMQKIGAAFGVRPYLVKRLTRPQRKPIYACALVGSRAVALMKQLRHFMGIRRQTQIDKALASYKSPKNHDKVYPTREQLLSHGMCSTNRLAKRYGVSRYYIDKVRGSNSKVYPTRDQLLSHGTSSTNALAKRYGVSWYYIDKVRRSCGEFQVVGG
jgi:hypothetical protein